MEQVQISEYRLRDELDIEKKKVCIKCTKNGPKLSKSIAIQTNHVELSATQQSAPGSTLIDQVDFQKMHDKYQQAKKMYLELNQKHTVLVVTHREIEANLSTLQQQYQTLETKCSELQISYNTVLAKYNQAKQICNDRAKFIQDLSNNFDESKVALDALQFKYNKVKELCCHRQKIIEELSHVEGEKENLLQDPNIAK